MQGRLFCGRIYSRARCLSMARDSTASVEFAAAIANASNLAFQHLEVRAACGETGMRRNWQPLRRSQTTPDWFGSSTITAVSKAKPNPGHLALVALERKCEREGKDFTLLTQNIDGLHGRAGSKNVVELHGSLWKIRCCTCGVVKENHDMPICPALEGKGAPDPSTHDADIPRSQLPHCGECSGLLRPHVVWFGECLDGNVMDRAHDSLSKCQLLVVAGTSAIVHPAAGFVPIVRGGGGIVAEFNLDETPASRFCKFKFPGACGETLPRNLCISIKELQGL